MVMQRAGSSLLGLDCDWLSKFLQVRKHRWGWDKAAVRFAFAHAASAFGSFGIMLRYFTSGLRLLPLPPQLAASLMIAAETAKLSAIGINWTINNGVGYWVFDLLGGYTTVARGGFVNWIGIIPKHVFHK